MGSNFIPQRELTSTSLVTASPKAPATSQTLTVRVSGIADSGVTVERGGLAHEKLVQPRCMAGHYAKTAVEVTALLKMIKGVSCHYTVCGG